MNDTRRVVSLVVAALLAFAQPSAAVSRAIPQRALSRLHALGGLENISRSISALQSAPGPELRDAALPGSSLPGAQLPSAPLASAHLSPAAQAAEEIGRAVPKPAEPLADESARGKTVMLVGTKSSRPFILKEALRVSRELGFELVLVDDPKNRKYSKKFIDDDHFIAAELDNRGDKNVDEIVARVGAYAQGKKIDAVVSFLSRHAKVTGQIVDKVGAAGIPGAAITAADDKAEMRAKLQEPGRKISSAEDAKKAFKELGGGKVVIKSARGENSRFVMLGIDSEKEAARAYETLDAEIKAFIARPEAQTTTFSSHPGILMEPMFKKVKGTGEISVELVMARGLPGLGVVSDTDGIGPNREFLGGSMTFPSRQSGWDQYLFIVAAARAAAAIGILDGSARVDMVMTEDGPKVIEVNPFMGGAGIWKAVKLLTGVSLVEQGLRATLGLAVDPGARPTKVVDYRFLAAKHTGFLEKTKHWDKARRSKGVRQLRLFVRPGERVVAAQNESYEEIGEIISVGDTIEEAVLFSYSALKKAWFWIKKDNGKDAKQSAAHLQPKKL